MSFTTGHAQVAVTTVVGGLRTEHFRDALEMVEYTLGHSGSQFFKDFLILALPRVIQEWRKAREGEAVMEQDCDRLLHDYELLTGAEIIANERHRQIHGEKWSAEHDDEHILGEMAAAAICYAFLVLDPEVRTVSGSPADWPWDSSWWKPSSNPIRNLAKAGALIAAEIDRLQRAEAKRLAQEKQPS